MATKSLCSVTDCGKPSKTRGMCSTHYNRWLASADRAEVGPANGTLALWIAENSTYEGDECLIWPFSRNPNGYACQVVIDGEKAYAHDHMCRVVHGPKPTPDHEVAHSCGNGRSFGCVDPRHVRWATRTENMDDMIDHGRTNRGEKCPSATLKREDVLKIRELIPIMKHKDIAAMFGITRPTVSLIKQRKTWAWLE